MAARVTRSRLAPWSRRTRITAWAGSVFHGPACSALASGGLPPPVDRIHRGIQFAESRSQRRIAPLGGVCEAASRRLRRRRRPPPGCGRGAVRRVRWPATARNWPGSGRRRWQLAVRRRRGSARCARNGRRGRCAAESDWRGPDPPLPSRRSMPWPASRASSSPSRASAMSASRVDTKEGPVATRRTCASSPRPLPRSGPRRP